MARPRLEGPTYRLVQRGDVFYVRWWEEGQWQRVSTRTKERRQAEVWLTQFAAGRGTPEPPEAPTVTHILDGYLTDRKSVVSAYDTLEVVAKNLRRHIGDLQPDHLTKERIHFYRRQRQTEGHWVGPRHARRRKPTSDGTLIRELVTLRAALKWAHDVKWIANLPNIDVPSSPPARDRWLTREEADRLLTSAQALHVKTFIMLALHTAARSGAILDLTWDRVNFAAGVIHMGMSNGNKRRGIVPVNDRLRPALECARMAATSDWVIEYGGVPVASIKTGFRAAARRAGLSDISPHVLRHTAVTWMVQENVPMQMIARFAAMSVEMVERRYGHHSPDYLRQAADALAG